MSSPKQTDPQFKLRLTPELRDEIEAAAKANNRSMNAEIISRLTGEQRTLRDQFAFDVMPTIIAMTNAGTIHLPTYHMGTSLVSLSEAAYELADAMLTQREKGGGK